MLFICFYLASICAILDPMIIIDFREPSYIEILPTTKSGAQRSAITVLFKDLSFL